MNKCCDFGEFKCDVQIISCTTGLNIYVDRCIADIITALNRHGIKTIASCCGHGKIDGSIILEDGRHIRIEKNKLKKERE